MNNNINYDMVFTPLQLRNITLKNRLIRSATYEGCGDSYGYPISKLYKIYDDLARGGVGTIITGFAFISQDGRAMQRAQTGIDNDNKIKAWSEIIAPMKKQYPEVALFLQLAHAGRQTLSKVTKHPVVGVSTKKCTYFKQEVKQLTNEQIEKIIEQFGLAAKRAKTIGFDGVQIHAAHGYLVHQFLSPWTNTRKDKWSNRSLFLAEVINSIRHFCGDKYPVLVKLSAEDDNHPGIRIEDTIQTVQILHQLNVDAVEISYGTMEYGLNIIRGAIPIDVILKINPLFNQKNLFLLKAWQKLFLPRYLKLFKAFTNNYNLDNAIAVKQANPEMPVISVGGIRTTSEIRHILNQGNVDAVALSRPLICDPGFANKIKRAEEVNSSCTNCNLCTVYCDSKYPLRCFNSMHER